MLLQKVSAKGATRIKEQEKNMSKKLKSKVEIKGSKKDGFTIIVSDSEGFYDDMAVTEGELKMLEKAIAKKIN